MSTEVDLVTKLPRLSGAQDFINWRRRLKAYICRKDVDLQGIEEKPHSVNSDVTRDSRKKMIKAKTAIILTLDSGLHAQMSSIIDDDDRSAKELWE